MVRKRYNKFFLYLGLFILFCSISISYFYIRPVLPDTPTGIYIKQGSTHRTFADLLKKRGIVKNTFLTRVLLWFSNVKIKKGEYLLPSRGSFKDIVYLINTGKVYQRFITFPEGIGEKDICKILQTSPGLQGNCPSDLIEGSILPNTYAYIWGQNRKDFIDLLKKIMQEKIKKIWEKRPDTILKTPQEMIILASIVEKETSIPKERPVVASVFLNRLRKKIPLQADPTVLYGVNKARLLSGKCVKTSLSKEDLREETKVNPYNTYKATGLPPTPIGLPSLESINSVLFPSKTSYLYFVADGKGGHVFSCSLKEHQKYHKIWREHRKTQKKDK